MSLGRELNPHGVLEFSSCSVEFHSMPAFSVACTKLDGEPLILASIELIDFSSSLWNFTLPHKPDMQAPTLQSK